MGKAFERDAAWCAQQLRKGRGRALAVRYEKLKQEARRVELGAVHTLPQIGQASLAPTGAQLTTLLESCGGPDERAEQSLRVLLAHCVAGRECSTR